MQRKTSALLTLMNNRQLFLQNMAQTSPFPLGLEIEYAEGCRLFDRHGNSWLDLISGISVSNLGHRHPAVVEAVKAQLDKYTHLMVYGEYVLNPQAQLAGTLASVLPDTLNNVYFVNSGAEAVEGALKLAKRYTGRAELISCVNAYHGSTHGALSIMGEEFFKKGYRPLLPGVKHIRFNAEEDLELITEKTACVVIEVVQAEAGVQNPAIGYLQAVKKRCREMGTLLIFDEIQTGYGRTGPLFAFEKQGVVPDVLLLAKGFGGGLPLGAFIASNAIMSVLMENPVLGHITTFGGNPVCCASSLATLKVLQESQILKTVSEKEQKFRELLCHPSIVEVRSAGLLIAVELESAAKNQAVIAKCLEAGLVTDWFLFNDRCLRIAPPLIISNEEIEWACSVLLKAVEG